MLEIKVNNLYVHNGEIYDKSSDLNPVLFEIVIKIFENFLPFVGPKNFHHF